MQVAPNEFLKLINNPVKGEWFLFSQLPSAWFSGVRVKEVNEQHALVTVPYKWFSKNPFRSTYFACLAMAAEMSTGILSMMNVYKRKPGVSMLVVRMEAAYYKKATGMTQFVCNDGLLIKEAVDAAIASSTPQTITVRSTGTNSAGEQVAVFDITWSYKARS